MTVLHHFIRSAGGKSVDTRGLRVAWLLETLLQASPLGKAPVLEYNGERLTESGAILFQLLSDASDASPDLETKISRDSMFWSHFAEGSLMMYIQPRVAVNNIAEGVIARDKGGDAQGAQKLQSVVQRWTGSNVTSALKQMDAFLTTHPNFSGTEKLGQGDFMMSYTLNQLQQEGQALPPHVLAWLERVRARPAWKRAIGRIREEEAKMRQAAKL